MKVEVHRNDLERETYKASGPGGQHRNKTSSGVRWRHVPTGIVAECCETRHQGQNSGIALMRLMDRLREHYAKPQEQARVAREAAKRSASMGNQDRTYRMIEPMVVVDHRTGVDAPVSDVLDGGLDGFIAESIRRNL